jgi:phosphatidylserine/phosphatidylglycerophosphate/cardiolipin synthase-like enzyme
MPEIQTTLAKLPADQLSTLAGAIQNRWITLNASLPTLANVVGSAATDVADVFTKLRQMGFTDTQAAVLIASIAAAKQHQLNHQVQADLVLSGPDVPGIPTSATEAVVQSLFQEAENEIILAGYAFHNAKAIFEPLAKRLQAKPLLKIILHVDISRGLHDTSVSASIVARFANDFWKKHWPWNPRPEIYYDPRALEADTKKRACLHAKFIIIDRRKVLITSANFTQAAQQRNIEAGLVMISQNECNNLTNYFEGLRNSRALLKLA